ncbi:hypothetical protein A7K94_0210345, partial [Modestobacter sp. VKM Ac-2676]
MSLPQRSPAPALSRPVAHAQQRYARPMVPGPRPAMRPAPAQPMAARPVQERPAPRPVAAFLTVAEVAG